MIVWERDRVTYIDAMDMKKLSVVSSWPDNILYVEIWHLPSIGFVTPPPSPQESKSMKIQDENSEEKNQDRSGIIKRRRKKNDVEPV